MLAAPLLKVTTLGGPSHGNVIRVPGGWVIGGAFVPEPVTVYVNQAPR